LNKQRGGKQIQRETKKLHDSSKESAVRHSQRGGKKITSLGELGGDGKHKEIAIPSKTCEIVKTTNRKPHKGAIFKDTCR